VSRARYQSPTHAAVGEHDGRERIWGLGHSADEALADGRELQQIMRVSTDPPPSALRALPLTHPEVRALLERDAREDGDEIPVVATRRA